MAEHSKQRSDADNNFLKVQTQSLARSRIVSEADSIAQARDENTAKLRQLRLQKEALEREAQALAPAKPKARRKIVRA
ncbi:hypothetical protein ASE66_10605 [Bosea sp. Root483D1]|uniref:hypothetical protein n=1 Tax=Bosea sp. Root483D1 TaxID=1736544 RepID=UPI00070F8270|nr:hypothetical protein [Bosea sp. Root483D1]KRE16195.1 hypothetical protein ASE66_10605 [Bosea sp. Root483D1]